MPHQFGIMINRVVFIYRGTNLQITIPDNSPLGNQEASLVACGAGSEESRRREVAAFLKGEKPSPNGLVSEQLLVGGVEGPLTT